MGSELIVGTANVGTKGRHKADPHAVLQVALECTALCLQQLSGTEGDQLVKLLRRHPDLRVLRRSRRAGQAAVGVAFRPDDLRLVTPVYRLLVPGQGLNPGTGPEHLKPKWLAGGTFEDRAADEAVTITSTHRVAGQTRHGDTERDQVATRHARRVGVEMHNSDGYKITGGDWNSLPDDDSLAPLRHDGWTCDQLQGDRLPTHGRWTPDHVWWQRHPGIRFHSHQLGRHTGGDHRPLVVTFHLG